MPIPQEWLQYAPKPRPLNDGNEWNVFLSYRSVNRSWVLNLYDVLTEIGHKVFLDQYVLKPGDKLINNLEAALNKTQAGILIWSRFTRDSVWVNDEYEALQQKANTDRNFVFVPVTIDNTALPVFAANRVYIDFTSYPDGPNGGDLLRLLYALAGTPLPGEVIHFANEQNEAFLAATAQVSAAIKQGRSEKLLQLFEAGGLAWKTTAALGCKAAEGLIKLKKSDDAITIIEKIEDEFKMALRPKQLKALALARRGKDGDVEKAQDILGELYERNHLDPETMGIYARTWMDRYNKSGDLNDLLQSRDLYAEAFEKAPDDYYTGINAAAKSVFIGTPKDLQKANDYAARVEKITGIETVPGDYWKTATIGEVFLIQKKYAAAADMYEKAVAMARTEKGSHESTFTQAKRLMEKLQPTDEERKMIEDAFKHLL
jgi:hypothetical protein